MTEAQNCRKCGQSILYHEGLQKYVNMSDGIGGRKGDEHSHSGNKGSQCNRCKTYIDPEKYPQCYKCFKQVCTACGYLFIWSTKQNTCNRCKHKYSKMIQITVYDERQHKYVPKDQTFIAYEVLQILEEAKKA
jgi:hypothetical protein